MSKKKKNIHEVIRERLAYVRSKIPVVRKLKNSGSEKDREDAETILKMLKMEHDDIREQIKLLKKLEALTPLEIIEPKVLSGSFMNIYTTAKQYKAKIAELDNNSFEKFKRYRDVLNDFYQILLSHNRNITNFSNKLKKLTYYLNNIDTEYELGTERQDEFYSEIKKWIAEFEETVENENFNGYFKQDSLFSKLMAFLKGEKLPKKPSHLFSDEEMDNINKFIYDPTENK